MSINNLNQMLIKLKTWFLYLKTLVLVLYLCAENPVRK